MTSTNDALGQAEAPEAPDPAPGGDPLVMARNLVAAVGRYAEALDRADPMQRLQASIAQAGERAHAGAQLAANLALVSAAGDLRRIADVLCRTDERLDQLDRAAAAEPAPEPLGDPLPGFEIPEPGE